MHWRRNWQPTPVFLPGESQGQRNLVGCRLWGCAESDRLKWLSSSSSSRVTKEEDCPFACESPTETEHFIIWEQKVSAFLFILRPRIPLSALSSSVYLPRPCHCPLASPHSLPCVCMQIVPVFYVLLPGSSPGRVQGFPSDERRRRRKDSQSSLGWVQNQDYFILSHQCLYTLKPIIL